MELSVHCRRWLAVILNLLFLGAGVWCDCPEQGMEMEGGGYILTHGLQHGSNLIYQCPPNFFPYPSHIRECHGSRWKRLPQRERNIRQKCRLVECPDPTVLRYGSVFPSQERYFVGNETSYECDSGYRHRGSVKRFCLANGKWNGSTPICSRDDAGNRCPDPGVPPGSLRSGDYFEYEDEVTYSCSNSMYLVGSKVRTCQADGQWSGTEPSCFYRYTYDTASDINEAFGGAMKQSLTESMSIGDTQEGRKITITKNGTLNMYIAVDISDSLNKEDIEKSTNMVHKLMERIASYAVSPNYDILFFTSELMPISNILDYYAGEGTKPLEVVLADLTSVKIKDNRASGTDLNQVFKHIYERIYLIEKNKTKTEFEDHRHIMLIFTDGGYNMGGTPLYNLQRIKETIKDKDRLEVYIFAVGEKIYEADLQPLAVGEQGRHFFRIQKEDLDDMFEEIFDDEAVVSLCGLHKTTDNSDFKHFMYPWNVELTILRGDQTSHKCSGAIVSSKLILTAAHCFHGDLPDKIQVDIKRLKDQEIKEVESYYIHPQYNLRAKENLGIPEFYDYDIALVQLKKDLIFTKDLKPICIPCTKETTQALRLPPDSKCSDQEKLLFKDFNQRLHFLTRGATMKEKTVTAKLGSNRGLCIKQATRLENVTAENLHEVVTDNFLCTGGTSPFVDHISCKGDSGGAVFRDYNQRTIQVGVVSWGTDNICGGHEGKLVKSQENTRDFHINIFKIIDFLYSVMAIGSLTLAPTEFIDNWHS